MTRRHLVILLVVFLASRLALLGAGALSMRVLSMTEGEEYTHLLDGGPALDMWYRWDAGFYATIAIEGYDWLNERQPSADMAFLPLYPALTRLASGIAGDGCVWSPYLSTCATIGGLIVSNAALLAGVLLLYNLARRHTDASVALRAGVLLCIAPNAVFLAGVYTEALFLLLVLIVFSLLDRERFGWAVAAACLACLTRSVGVALVPALLAWAWMHTAGRRRLVLMLGALIPGVVFGAYVLGTGLVVGQPLAYFSAYEGIWGRSTSVLDVILVYTREPVALLGWYPSWFDLAATVFLLALALWTLLRWKERVWGWYALAAVGIPLASGSLLSMPRFGAVIFSNYILVARWIDRPWKQALVYAGSIALALLILSRFVTWRWIA